MPAAPTIILTADETMMSKYRGGMFIGFTTCMPQGILPDWLYFRAFAPPVPRRNGRAVLADCGLRIIEAVLLENGFSEEEVAVVHPKDLDRMIGEETKIVAIGGHDHLGINPPTSEFVDLVRTGPPYNRVKFLELVRRVSRKNVKVVVGGKGAWQLADPKVMDKLGIDHVHVGEGEISVPRMFKAILRGEEVPRVVRGEDTPVDKIPNIRGAVIHGLVEISRGCGRGCKFCTPGMQKLRHKPVDHILKDVQVNLQAGDHRPILHAEDVLRYGTTKIEPREEKVVELFEKVAALEGVKKIDTSHVALATVYHNPDLVRKVSEIAVCNSKEKIGTQTGIETGSPELLEKYMYGKALPSPPEKWPEIVEQSLGILEDNNWVPACTLMVGLPGETREDVLKTLELMDKLRDSFSLIVPLFFVSMAGSALSKENSFTADKMLPEHWELLGVCLEHDVKIAHKLSRGYEKGSILERFLFRLAVRYLLKSAEKYAKILKRGEPPRDYSETWRYLTPEL